MDKIYNLLTFTKKDVNYHIVHTIKCAWKKETVLTTRFLEHVLHF